MYLSETFPPAAAAGNNAEDMWVTKSGMRQTFSMCCSAARSGLKELILNTFLQVKVLPITFSLSSIV